MGWQVECTNSDCVRKLRANNIVDLIAMPRDSKGQFLCSCGKNGYIKKAFPLQEEGGVWEPYLRGLIPLGKPRDTYQPFIFLVSYGPTGEVTDIWFSYYKDLRSSEGRLKLGYGPGGPPVLSKIKFLHLVSQLVATRCLTKREILDAISKSGTKQKSGTRRRS